jgi:hypothetical protein
MALCQAEAIARIRTASPLQAGKKLGPHHKFDFYLFMIFCCFFVMLNSLRYIRQLFPANEFN